VALSRGTESLAPFVTVGGLFLAVKMGTKAQQQSDWQRKRKYRNPLIVAAREAGETYVAIGKRWGISGNRARQIYLRAKLVERREELRRLYGD